MVNNNSLLTAVTLQHGSTSIKKLKSAKIILILVIYKYCTW